MNQKKAKMLRKQALKETVGLPNTSYGDINPPQYAPIEQNCVVSYKKIQLGIPTELIRSTRKELKQLKKQFKLTGQAGNYNDY